MQVQEYNKFLKEVESFNQLPKKTYEGNKTNPKFETIREKKKLENEQVMKNFYKRNEVKDEDLYIGAFIYTLAKYVGENKVIFSLLDKRQTIPIYKKIEEKDIKSFLKNIKQLVQEVKKYDIKELNKIENIIFSFCGDEETEKIAAKKQNEILFNVQRKPEILEVSIRYKKEYFEKRLMKNFIHSYFLVLESLLNLKKIKEIQYLTKSDKEILKKTNDTKIEISGNNIPELFEKQVAKNRNKKAVISNGKSLTYEELNNKANQIAKVLLKKGIKQQEVVTIILNRSIYSPVARQGILKAGGAFLNIISDYPVDRINYILKDCKSRFIITTKDIVKNRQDFFSKTKKEVIIIEEILTNQIISNPKIKIKPNNLCYCIFTSGSTGKPKGVMVEHRNLINYCNVNKFNKEAEVVGTNAKASLALATLTFDVSILEEFMPLLNGGTMVIATEEEIYTPIKLAKLIIENNVEVITCTPSFINNIIDIEKVQQAMKNIKKFNIGAESFPSSLFNKLKNLGTNAEIYNGYGPTEATIGCTFKKMTSGENITIGVPMANMKIYMIDKVGDILPIGVPGELTIVGKGVSRGYINREELNKEKFIKINGERAYRSGDLAKYNEHGEIEFIGRIDNQVKINGLRIELGEIEAVINSYKNIIASVAIVLDGEKGKYICTYYTSNTKVKIEELKKFISEKLPYYMIPKKFVQLELLPLNANGKVNRKELPKPTENEEKYIEPTNELEKKLCKIIEEILKIKKVGITDNFFEIGGDSLSVMKLITVASKENINISYKDVFNYPTIKALVKYMNNGIKSNKDDENIKLYDYNKINQLIKVNNLDNIKNIEIERFNNIVITGATGFLGIHLLWEFVKDYKGIAYCIVRKGKFSNVVNRMKSLYKYYFNENFEDILNERVVLIEGDITDKKCFEHLKKYDIDILINCAAIVKYFNAGDLIDKVNVQGVKNAIEYCKNNNIKLIQISTTSIGGTKEINEDIKPFKENVLYFGQGLENKYSSTKFLAERMVISEIANGLNAKVMRIGNLMPRYSDNKFQINYLDNGFMGMLRGFKLLQTVPSGLLGETIELSPVDSTAKAILLLANTNKKYNVYHPFNNNIIHYYDLIHIMQEAGFDINIVSNEEFKEKLNKEIKQDENKSKQYIGLVADLTASSNKKVLEVDANNTFSTEVLYKMGFKWPKITDEYLSNTVIQLENDKELNAS